MELTYTICVYITEEVAEKAISWINDQLHSNHKTLKLYISSQGGDIDSAIRLYDFLKAIPLKVETIGFGQVDSSAIAIFLAGEKRTAIKNCRFRIHEPIYYLENKEGLLTYFEDNFLFFKELDRRIKEIIATETKKSQEEIASIYRKSKTFTPEEAKEYGIVHEIAEKFPYA